LVEILRLDANYQLVGEAGDGQTAVQLCLETNPDVCVLDAKLPGLNGVDILRRISKKLPQMRVLVFSGHETRCSSARCWRPARMASSRRPPGCSNSRKASRPSPRWHVLRAGSAALLRNVVANPATSSAPDFLTDREREILQLVAESHSTKEIAAKLGISVKTVATTARISCAS